MNGAGVMPNLIVPNSEMVRMLTAEYLTPAEVAASLQVSRKTLADWRFERQGPPFELKARGVVVYPAESFRRYLRALSQKDCREGLGRREARWSRTVKHAVNISN